MKKVLIAGCFDLLHYGHISMLKKAKSLGDYLIVSVLSDERIKFKKGNSRPIIPEYERVQMVKELKCVDEVICLAGKEFPMFELLYVCKPDIIVMDDNQLPYTLLLETKCNELGIKFIREPRIITESGLDTTKIINKIKNG